MSNRKLNKPVNLIKSVLLVALISLVAACQQVPTQGTPSKPNGYSRVTSDVLPSLFGKQLSLDGNYFSLAADGSFTGSWNDAPMAGTWKMENDYFCRTLTQFFKPENTGSEDCQLWEIRGDNVRGTRDKGNGGSFVYTIQ